MVDSIEKTKRETIALYKNDSGGEAIQGNLNTPWQFDFAAKRRLIPIVSSKEIPTNRWNVTYTRSSGIMRKQGASCAHANAATAEYGNPPKLLLMFADSSISLPIGFACIFEARSRVQAATEAADLDALAMEGSMDATRGCPLKLPQAFETQIMIQNSKMVPSQHGKAIGCKGEVGSFFERATQSPG